MSCCKRYSAEKRYYPYGKDEEGIAKAISEGLVNPNGKSVRQAAPGAKQVCYMHWFINRGNAFPLPSEGSCTLILYTIAT